MGIPDHEGRAGSSDGFHTHIGLSCHHRDQQQDIDVFFRQLACRFAGGRNTTHQTTVDHIEVLADHVEDLLIALMFALLKIGRHAAVVVEKETLSADSIFACHPWKWFHSAILVFASLLESASMADSTHGRSGVWIDENRF